MTEGFKMSNTIYGYTSRKIKASLNGEMKNIALSTFVCMANDLCASDYSNNALRKPSQARCNRRVSSYRKKVSPPELFVELINEKKGLDNLIYSTVTILPENFEGIYDEYQQDKFERVGTLMRDGRKWYIETDLEKIELLRREIEFQKMKDGFLSIGCFGNDFNKYKAHLAEKDLANRSMVTRGHGI
jgi:hypothetical protein